MKVPFPGNVSQPLEPLLIPSEDVTGVYLLLHVIKACVLAVGDDGPAFGLEHVEVVNYPAAEEVAAVL